MAPLRGHWSLLLAALTVTVLRAEYQLSEYEHHMCYSATGEAQFCRPIFENAAYQQIVRATNTCGLGEAEAFCRQTQSSGNIVQCSYCNDRVAGERHPASHVTDNARDESKVTFWQSQTMYHGVGKSKIPTVNLTLDLGKSHEIGYIRLKFHTSRPESFAIYKRTNSTSDWEPYQYYSASCRKTYSIPTVRSLRYDQDEKTAICTDEYSDISPLTGGTVAFGPLLGRTYTFDINSKIQDWLTATEIKIVLRRLNTYGDEVFSSARIEGSYYYAISDFAVGARCLCNGHASSCKFATGSGLSIKKCNCEHNTKGQDCEQCQPFYMDTPWKRGSQSNPNVCNKCQCNGKATRCKFDPQVYRETGSGGVCIDCRENTYGNHCENCKHTYYNENVNGRDRCVACNCNRDGSQYEQCDKQGMCRCKSGVTGDKCDRCMNNYHGFSSVGCRACTCNVAGRLQVSKQGEALSLCDKLTGSCTCKDNVEGQQCDVCKNGFYSLTKDNVHGCRACFCFGQTSDCVKAVDYSRHMITSTIYKNHKDGFSAENIANGEYENTVANDNNMLQASSQYDNTTEIYFVLPDKYTGDQKLSYGAKLRFVFRTSSEVARSSQNDIIIEGKHQTISTTIRASGIQPTTENQQFEFILSEHRMYQWSPTLSNIEFIRVLSDIKSIKIRATYGPLSYGYIKDVTLESAARSRNTPRHLQVDVEKCTCPRGYIGQFCESCQSGFYRQRNGDKFSTCVPCNCNEHSRSCDTQTGKCLCQHNTEGNNCELCRKGYYGNAQQGTPNDCQKCDCPDGGDCIQLLSGEMACINCKNGYTGNKCDHCIDGFYGNPRGIGGRRTECRRCECNNNIDNYAVRNCDRKTGQCLKCIRNTAGSNCERCLPNYYGNALLKPNAQCTECACDRYGAVGKECHPTSGQCQCKPNVKGLRCSECIEETYNILSGNGCTNCNCNVMGSVSRHCDSVSGRCQCKQNIEGRKCDKCMPETYGLSATGCKACECDVAGSKSRDCDINTGSCICKENIMGRRCDQCMENKYRSLMSPKMCLDCPVCYNLVQERVHIHRQALLTLSDLLRQINSNPRQQINDKDFRDKLTKAVKDAEDLLELAETSNGLDDSVASKLLQIRDALAKLKQQCDDISTENEATRQRYAQSKQMIVAFEQKLTRVQQLLNNANNNNEGMILLSEARDLLVEFGQKSSVMTSHAEKAKKIATSHEEISQNILNIVQDAENNVNETEHLATETLAIPFAVQRNLTDIGNLVFSAKQLHEKVEQESAEVLELTKQVYSDSLSLKTTVDSVIINDNDLTTIEAEIVSIRREAQDIKDETAALSERNRETLDLADAKLKDIERLLKRGHVVQQRTDKLLADADASRSKAKESLTEAEKILTDAKESLRKLQDFNQNVNTLKEESQRAYNKRDELLRKLQTATKLSDEATISLGNAVEDSIEALELSVNANLNGKSTATKLKLLLIKITSDQKQLVSVEEAALQLEIDILAAFELLKEREATANRDRETYDKTVNKVAYAKEVANNTVHNVETALMLLQDIKAKLSNLDKINSQGLDDLEDKLNEAKRRIEQSDLINKLKLLREANKRQDNWVRLSTNEYIRLRKDVANLQVISVSMPLGCYKDIKLEPEKIAAGL